VTGETNPQLLTIPPSRVYESGGSQAGADLATVASHIPVPFAEEISPFHSGVACCSL
jgi:hypothetical protein